MRAAFRRSHRSVVWRFARWERYRIDGSQKGFRRRRRHKLLIDTKSMAHGAMPREGLLGNDLLEFRLACQLVMEMRN